MLYPKTIKLADANIKNANASSRNDFIEKSIHFYVGYLNSQDNISYLNEIIENTITANISSLDDSISRLLFKFAIELNIIMNVLALHFDIEDNTLEILRNKSIKQVQETIGKVDLDEVFKQFK